MQIEYQSGDFIAGPEHLIVHGCNAQGVMGRGVALAVKERLPFAYRAYRESYLLNWGRPASEVDAPLGHVIWAFDIGENVRPRIVGNAITQEHWEPDKSLDGRHVSYQAVHKAMLAVDRFVQLTQDMRAETYIDIAVIGPITRVAMPKIGAGLGGGDWSRIAEIIEISSIHFTPIVYEL